MSAAGAKPDISKTIEECAPGEALEKLISKLERGLSKVGFIADVLMFRETLQLNEKLNGKILSYLFNKPDMLAVIRDYAWHINVPSMNGYSWLHHAVMTHEISTVRQLLDSYGANPNLQPVPLANEISQPADISGKQEKRGPAYAIIGPGDDHLIGDDKDIEILNTRFTHSSPLHYAAQIDDPTIFAMLMKKGADLDQTAGNRPGGVKARDLIRQDSSIQAYQQRMAEKARVYPVSIPAPVQPVFFESRPAQTNVLLVSKLIRAQDVSDANQLKQPSQLMLSSLFMTQVNVGRVGGKLIYNTLLEKMQTPGTCLMHEGLSISNARYDLAPLAFTCTINSEKYHDQAIAISNTGHVTLSPQAVSADLELLGRLYAAVINGNYVNSIKLFVPGGQVKSAKR